MPVPDSYDRVFKSPALQKFRRSRMSHELFRRLLKSCFA